VINTIKIYTAFLACCLSLSRWFPECSDWLQIKRHKVTVKAWHFKWCQPPVHAKFASVSPLHVCLLHLYACSFTKQSDLAQKYSCHDISRMKWIRLLILWSRSHFSWWVNSVLAFVYIRYQQFVSQGSFAYHKEKVS